jgi:hypothetical protein
MLPDRRTSLRFERFHLGFRPRCGRRMLINPLLENIEGCSLPKILAPVSLHLYSSCDGRSRP